MIPYKKFEQMADLQRKLSERRNDLARYTLISKKLDEIMNLVGWPWKASSEQRNDWNALCQRIDSHLTFNAVDSPALHRCGDCGAELQLVCHGKYQCPACH